MFTEQLHPPRSCCSGAQRWTRRPTSTAADVAAENIETYKRGLAGKFDFVVSVLEVVVVIKLPCMVVEFGVYWMVVCFW